MTEEKFLKANSKDFFGEHSDGLTPRERDVIILHYGMNGSYSRSQKEISEIYGVSVKEIKNNLNKARKKMTTTFFSYYELLFYIFGDLPPINYFDFEELKTIMDELLETLPNKEKCALQLRFGLNDNKWLTLAKMGEIMGLSREGARLNEERGLRKLQKQCRSGKLKELVENYKELSKKDQEKRIEKNMKRLGEDFDIDKLLTINDFQ